MIVNKNVETNQIGGKRPKTIKIVPSTASVHEQVDRMSPVSEDSGISSDVCSSAFDVNVFLKVYISSASETKNIIQKTLNDFDQRENELLLSNESDESVQTSMAKLHPTKRKIDEPSTSCNKIAADNSSDFDRTFIPVEFGRRPVELSASKESLISSKFSTTSECGGHLCRICHQRHESARDPMISPCRCAGTMKFVHTSCLVHWLEISTKKMCPAPRCELCGYNYKRRHCLDLQRFHLPHVAGRDRVLNAICIIVLFIMFICGAMSIYFLHMTDQYHTVRTYRTSSALMTQEDIVVIICSILFFAAFFIAVFTQYRAEASICRVFFRFWLINRNWRIRNYDLMDDPDMLMGNNNRLRLVDQERTARSAARSDENRRPLAAEFCII